GRTGGGPGPSDRKKPDRHAWRYLHAEIEAAHRHRSYRHLPAGTRDERAGADGRGGPAPAAGTNRRSGRRRQAADASQTDHECRNRPLTESLALGTQTISLSINEQRNAVYRSLYDGPQNQTLLRLRTNVAGDRTLAPHGDSGAIGRDGRACGAHGGGRPRADAAARRARLIPRRILGRTGGGAQ